MELRRDFVLTSTALDWHGESFSDRDIRRFFEKMPDSLVMNQHHDVSQRPVARALNKRLLRVNGELAIVADIEVIDEEAFATLGGFSIAYLRRSFQTQAGQPIFEVRLNPRDFDFEAAMADIAAIPSTVPIAVTERVEKTAQTSTAILQFVINMYEEVGKGALWYIGAEITRRILFWRRKSPGPVEYQIHLEFFTSGRRLPVILRVDEGLAPSHLAAIPVQGILIALNALPNPERIVRVSGYLRPSGSVVLDHAVEVDGSVLELREILKTLCSLPAVSAAPFEN